MTRTLALLLTLALAAPTFAAIDTKAKRGSVLGMASPLSPLTAEPGAAVSEAGRLSLLGLAATDAGASDYNSYLIAHLTAQDNAASTVVVNSAGAPATLTGAGNTSASSTTGPGGSYPLALDLDGSNDYIAMAGIANWLSSDGGSLVLWVKRDEQTPSTAAVAGFGNFGAVVGQASVFHAMHMPFTDGNAYLGFARAASNDNTQRFSAGSMGATVRTNWNHYAITATGGTNAYKFYENGSVLAQTNGVAAYWDDDGWWIGRSRGWGAVSFEDWWLPGQVADIRIYNRALSEAEIDSIMALGQSSGAKPWLYFPINQVVQ